GNVSVGVNSQAIDSAGRTVAQNLFDSFIKSDLLRRKFHLRGFDIASRRGFMPARPPVVLWVQAFTPRQPLFARLIGQQILFLEPLFEREAQRALAHQQNVIRALEYDLGDARWILDVMQASDRPGSTRRSVHHARVQLDLAILVRQSAVAYGIVVGIIL